MLILIVASGPDKGRIYELFDDKPVVIGREGDAVRVNDRKASRKHARLWAEGEQWYVADCQSRHGTYRNNERITETTPLKDGDRLKVGSTTFVLARMSVEQAERLALLGDPASADAFAPMRPSRRLRPYVLGAAGLAAASIVVALNVFTYVATNQQAEQVRHDLAQAHSAAQRSTDQLLAQLQQINQTSQTADDSATRDSDLLRQVLAAIEAQQAGDRLLSEIHAAVLDHPQQAKPLLEAVLAQTEAQREQARVLEELRLAVRTQQTQTRPVFQELLAAAQAAEANRAALAQLQDQLAALPPATPPAPPAAPVVDERLPQMLETILAELRQRPTAEQVLAPLQASLAQGNAQNTQKDDAALEALEQVLARLDAQPSAQQIAAALEARHAPPAPELIAKLDRIEQQIAAIEPAAVGLPAAEADRLAQRQTEATELLQAILAQLQDHGPIDALREQVQQLAARPMPTPPEAPDLQPMLGQILEAIEARADADARLAEIQTLLEAMPEQEQARTQAVLAAVQGQPDPSEQIAELRSTLASAMSVLEGMRAKVGLEFEMMLEQVRLAVAAQPTAAPEGQPVNRSSTLASARPSNGTASAMPSALLPNAVRPVVPAPAAPPALSRTEEAYRLAFETGQPITLGAGVLNPVTGEVSEGRTLDPAAARALGIKHWRDWYLMDNFAEQARLQKQAIRHARQERSTASIIDLPQALIMSNPPASNAASTEDASTATR